MEEDRQIPIILGRLFLATARVLIDVEKGELTLRVQNQQVTFNIFKALKLLVTSEDCFSVSVVNNFIHDVFLEENPNDPLEACLVANSDRDDDEFIEYSNLLNAHFRFRTNHQFEFLNISASLMPASKPSIEEPLTLELKPLPAHLSYAFLGKSFTLSVIISTAFTSMQEEKLLRTLRQFKKAIRWTIADIKGISPSVCMHKILLEENHKATIEQQRRLNPIMKEVVKKEIIKWLDARIIYPICDSSWVSLVQCVPKKEGMALVANDNNELILTRIVTGWKVCMDYRKLNKATRKDHFPLPFIDQILDRLAGKKYYCFLDGYSGYNQIAIAPEDQEKTTFTCIYGTFAFRRMPFGLCNALATFQRCMMAIFTDMVEKCLEAQISSSGIEVDKAKIEAIEKLPPSINVKDVPFKFDNECLVAFDELKKRLIFAPIVISLDWTLPLELMCDASDYAVGATLGQRKDKLFHSIYYASKTLNEA
ncbi:Reverse transcriptase domain - like 10 [Theobroma cacao]|nr:Reverse transcriptase domain - like 10 [Theobroma cacao]